MSWAAVGEFVLVFSLAWIAWLNGAVHYDLHGRQDVSSRTSVFIQMLLVALLAIYAGDGEGGRDGFAVLYTVFLLVLAWLWYSAHARANEQYRRASRVYLAVLVLLISMMAGSVFAPPFLQLLVWGAVAFVWLCTGYYVSRAAATWYDEPLVSESLVERFGLFTIIVLGEVVVGVVNGIADSERSVAAIATGILALGVGFGLWWVYFDLVGRRIPRAGRSGLPVWMTLHLPLTMAIAAAGAAMVGVIEHADDPQTHEISSWVLCGSVGVSLATIAAMVRTLADWGRHRSIYLPATVSMTVLAVCSGVLGLLRPEPIVLVSVLYAFLNLVWCVYVLRWLKLEEGGNRS